MTAWWAASSISSVSTTQSSETRKTYSWLAEMPSCGHFSRAVVSDFRSLRRDIVFRSFLARQSPAAKIPFQTRRRKGKCGRRRGGRHVGRKRVVCGPAHSATTLRLICRERHESSSRSAPHSVQTLVAMTCFIKRLPSLTDAIEFQKLRQYRSSISESAS